MRYIVSRCEVCGAADKPQLQPPAMKHIRHDDKPSERVSCCHDCAVKIDTHNKPYDDKEREADEAAKAIMDAKLAAVQTEEDAKKKQEGALLENLAKQNDMMLQMMQQTQNMFALMMEQNAKPRRNRKPRQEVQPPEPVN